MISTSINIPWRKDKEDYINSIFQLTPEVLAEVKNNGPKYLYEVIFKSEIASLDNPSENLILSKTKLFWSEKNNPKINSEFFIARKKDLLLAALSPFIRQILDK